jgi:glycosyltransferase involved in cell wall biosynthesis
MALSAALGVAKRVRFLGFREDVRCFYHALDAHLSCSLGSETSSLALAEGMSAGCPTVASDTEGNRARVGRGGLLFPAGDDAALAACIRALTPDGRARLSRRALARARELPTWESVSRAYDALFASFLRDFSRKGCFFR